MPDDKKIRTEYAHYRLERAAEDLETAKANYIPSGRLLHLRISIHQNMEE